MALMKSDVRNAPEGAVRLTEDEALKHQMNIVQNWKNTSEVLGLKCGPFLLGTSALISSAFFNNFFRRQMKLVSLGRIATYLPICAFPGILAPILHTEFVLKNILLMKDQTCPVCLELRSALIQSSVSVAYPLIVAPLGCGSLAQRYFTIDMPDNIKGSWNMLKTMYNKVKRKSFYIVLFQAVLGSAITYIEASNIINISQKLKEDSQSELLLS